MSHPKIGLGGLGIEEQDVQDFAAGNVDLFSMPKLEKGMHYGKDTMYYPLNAVQDKGPYTFVIPGEGNEYTLLPLMRLYGQISIVKEDGTDIGDDDNVSIVNMAPYALFANLEVFANGIPVVHNSKRNYMYVTYLTEHISYCNEAKKTWMVLHGFMEDTPGKQTITDITGDNIGLKNRQKWIKGSRKMGFSIPIHSAINFSERLFPPNVEYKISFERGSDDFVLLCKDATTKYKIKISDLELEARKIICSPEVVKYHAESINKTNIKYPLSVMRVHEEPINSGTTKIVLSNVVRGKLPNQIIIGLVNQEAFKGSVTKNPYNFQHYNLSEFFCTINGTPFPQTPIKADFTGNNVVRLYQHFIDSCGILTTNTGNGITWDMFLNGSTFFCIDFNPDKCNGYHIHETQVGNLDIHLTFSEALKESITMLAYMGFNNEFVTIDKDRNVHTTF